MYRLYRCVDTVQMYLQYIPGQLQTCSGLEVASSQALHPRNEMITKRPAPLHVLYVKELLIARFPRFLASKVDKWAAIRNNP